MKSLMIITGCLVSVLLCGGMVLADEPDFIVSYLSCKNTVGYLVLSDESLKVVDGDPLTMACHRRSNDISCNFIFDEGQKGHRGNSENYKVVVDSPPHLSFATENGSEYISIDTNQHAAVLISRLLHEKYVGAKICQGMYVTSFEIKNLQ